MFVEGPEGSANESQTLIPGTDLVGHTSRQEIVAFDLLKVSAHNLQFLGPFRSLFECVKVQLLEASLCRPELGISSDDLDPVALPVCKHLDALELTTHHQKVQLATSKLDHCIFASVGFLLFSKGLQDCHR